MTDTYDKAGLIALLRSEFRLDWHGVHGAPHWARGRHHGRYLARLRAADTLVVDLFALLHDSQRQNDFRDPLHGHRAAEFAAALNGRCFDLAPRQLDWLTLAMTQHSDGHLSTNATVQSCWDADRLDLGRVGIMPHPRLLSVPAAARIDYGHALSVQATAARHYRMSR